MGSSGIFAAISYNARSVTLAMSTTKLAAIGVGTNLGPRLELIQKARELLELTPHTKIVRAAKIYETKAIGPAQPDYLNTAWCVETTLSAEQLFKELMHIEQSLGRAPRSESTRWQARTMDLDLLCYAGEKIETPSLTVPHPELTKRAFALAPLLEVLPQLQSEYGPSLKALGGPPLASVG